MHLASKPCHGAALLPCPCSCLQAQNLVGLHDQLYTLSSQALRPFQSGPFHKVELRHCASASPRFRSAFFLHAWCIGCNAAPLCHSPPQSQLSWRFFNVPRGVGVPFPLLPCRAAVDTVTSESRYVYCLLCLCTPGMPVT